MMDVRVSERVSDNSQLPGGQLLPLGVSVVLYRTPVTKLLPLVDQFLRQGAARVYLVDNSPPGFDTFGDWTPPERVTIMASCLNLGYGRGNNLAIRDSVRRHRYHIISNPDIQLGDNLLPELCALLDGRPDVGLCGPRIVDSAGETQYLCKRAPSVMDLFVRRFAPRSWFRGRRDRYEMRDHSYDREMEPFFISGCFMFFRSTILSQLDGFDERYFLYVEDLDLSRRSRQLARNIYYPHNHVVHGHQRGAHKSVRLLLNFGASVVRYFNKWGWTQSSDVPRVFNHAHRNPGPGVGERAGVRPPDFPPLACGQAGTDGSMEEPDGNEDSSLRR